MAVQTVLPAAANGQPTSFTTDQSLRPSIDGLDWVLKKVTNQFSSTIQPARGGLPNPIVSFVLLDEDAAALHVWRQEQQQQWKKIRQV